MVQPSFCYWTWPWDSLLRCKGWEERLSYKVLTCYGVWPSCREKGEDKGLRDKCKAIWQAKPAPGLILGFFHYSARLPSGKGPCCGSHCLVRQGHSTGAHRLLIQFCLQVHFADGTDRSELRRWPQVLMWEPRIPQNSGSLSHDIRPVSI